MPHLKSVVAGLCMFVAACGMLAGSAQAGLIHTLTPSLGTGQIEFDSTSGSDVSGVVAFSFDVNVGSTYDRTYTEAHIGSIQWTIDSNWNLSLELVTDLIPIPMAPASTGLRLSNISTTTNRNPCYSGPEGAVYSYTCLIAIGGQASVGDTDPLETAAVHAVPAPAAATVFLIGLAGLGATRRLRAATK